MYQEIGRDNILLSICRICGATRKRKIAFNGKASDDHEYFGDAEKDTVQNFNIKVIEKGKGD